jgi:glutathione peroxidase
MAEQQRTKWLNDKSPTWNFCKYVLSTKGQVTNFFASGVKLNDAALRKRLLI